jgi:hypothetical protein
MPPWSGLFSGGTGEGEVQITPNKRGVDTAFETFIDGALCKVHQEANGRSKEQKAIREACKKVLGKHITFSVSAAHATRIMHVQIGLPRLFVCTSGCVSGVFTPPPSLSLSLSHTHTHTHILLCISPALSHTRLLLCSLRQLSDLHVCHIHVIY